jgi:hypothetical protein
VTRPLAGSLLLLCLALATAGCDTSRGGEPAGPRSDRIPDYLDDFHEPNREPSADTEAPAGRRLKRMSAEQFHASLEVATGQRWPDFERHARTMGRPDLVEVTEEDLRLSVAFDKLVGDAARYACHAAVEADRAGGDEAPVILRHVDLAEDDPEARLENLRYLLLRFHGKRITDEADSRLGSWLPILEAPIEIEDAETSEQDLRALRWEALCVGLVTHVDFLTY